MHPGCAALVREEHGLYFAAVLISDVLCLQQWEIMMSRICLLLKQSLLLIKTCKALLLVKQMQAYHHIALFVDTLQPVCITTFRVVMAANHLFGALFCLENDSHALMNC
uniref:Uncharacterized protein n=1 Tax=Ditylenchus dipsaci TaxID=166011 RepID=A0A915E2Y1_9BILA